MLISKELIQLSIDRRVVSQTSRTKERLTDFICPILCKILK